MSTVARISKWKRVSRIACLAVLLTYLAGAVYYTPSINKLIFPSTNQDLILAQDYSDVEVVTTTSVFQSRRPETPCEALLNIPQVALLFLTPGKLPHERLWREWAAQVAGLLPVREVIQYSEDGWSPNASKFVRIHESCFTPYRDFSLPFSDRQFLFTFYVHTHPEFNNYHKFSLFHSKIVPNRIVAERGKHSLTVAERLLLSEALKNPRNQRFLLLSDTTIPIYPAAMIYQQALAEQHSRVDACNYKTNMLGNLERWKAEMETDHFKKEHWRKTSQWFSLTRKHAELILADKEINEKFEKYCHPFHDPVKKRKVSCSSNEHYIAVVLAVYNLSHETTCNGMGTTFVDWSRMTGDGRPRAFRKREIKPKLFRQVRAAEECTAQQTDAAIATAMRQYVHVLELQFDSAFSRLKVPEAYEPLNHNCSIFMRKFPADTKVVVREVVRHFVQTRLDSLSD